MTQVTDEFLLQSHRGGDDRALATLIQRYELDLFHFLVRFTSDAQAAEDLFQETFLQVHLAMDQFDPQRKFKPWLFAIAANKARDHLRKVSKHSMVSLSAPGSSSGGDGDDGLVVLDLLKADMTLPVENLERKEVGERVQAAVADMPQHLREVLVMAYFHQFSYREMAEMLSVPLGTIKSRLHAAVAQFARRWQERTGESAESEDAEDSGASEASGGSGAPGGSGGSGGGGRKVRTNE